MTTFATVVFWLAAGLAFLLLVDVLTTVAEERVLATLDETEWRYGLDLVREHGLPRGGIYTALARLEDKGLVESRPDGTGRRLYRRKQAAP